MHASCKVALGQLHECKKQLGLLPQQCYPLVGYNGKCDAYEHEYKKCLAYAADRRDATVLYSKSAPRQARAEANARLQKRLRKYNQPCTH